MPSRRDCGRCNVVDVPIETRRKEELVDITQVVRGAVEDEGAADGVCFVYSPHTTAGVTVNEAADPAVAEDLLAAFAQLVPEDVAWRHREGNSPAHVKASLVGSSVTVGIERGHLCLGRWQGIFLCEFDGPRTRHVRVGFLR